MLKRSWNFLKRKMNKYQIKRNEPNGNWNGKFFPPDLEDVYVIAKWYADAPAPVYPFCGDKGKEITDEEDGLVGLELRFFLSSSDWYKFQEQPFYPELMQYLDSLKIQKEQEFLDEEEDL